jgi:hypothetical protein
MRVSRLMSTSTGEKMLPILTEGALLANPYVDGVAMFGRQRTHTGLLVEPRAEYSVDPNDATAIAALRSSIW